MGIESFFPPAIFWQIMLAVILIIGFGYFFGIFDKINITYRIAPIAALISLYAVVTLIIYITFAFWHKLMGPMILGG
jgi:fumarate reductase subunit D